MSGIDVKYAAALSKVENPDLDGNNPHFNSKFSTLKEVLKAVKAACSGEGIAYRQSIDDGYLKSHVLDEEGNEKPLSCVPITFDPNPQKTGSQITYMRRYVALTDFGIVGDPDDDGNEAAKTAAKSGGEGLLEKTRRRVYELQAEASELGMPEDYAELTANATYGKDVAQLTLDQLNALGKAIKASIEQVKEGS